jgi:glycogen(starch) synthase
VPSGAKEIRPEVLQNKSYFDDVAESVYDRTDEIKERIVNGLVSKKPLDYEYLFGKQFLLEEEKKVLRFSKSGNPPPATHYLYNEQDDEILRAFKANGLNNSKEDRVKVVFYPIYLTGADQLLDLSYYEAIMACHLGVFPSYYEPWGYTPLEAGACGIASVTTDLAGFGKYVQKISDGKKNQGIYVLNRLNKSDEEVTNNLLKVFMEFTLSSKQDRIDNKLRAKRIADTADWALMAENYIKAHNLAADRNG